MLRLLQGLSGNEKMKLSWHLSVLLGFIFLHWSHFSPHSSDVLLPIKEGEHGSFSSSEYHVANYSYDCHCNNSQYNG